MKKKTIRRVIRKKVANWLESIEDESLRKLLAENVIVTGGVIPSMLLDEKIIDFDIYFRTHAATLAAVTYYVNKFKANPPPKYGVRGTGHISISDDDDRIKIIIKSDGIAGDPSVQLPDGDSDAYVETAATVVECDKPESKEGEKKPKYRPIFLSANAITLSDKVQLIARFYGEPEEIHKFYDYAHCTCYWTSWDNRLVLRPHALECLLAKDLRYRGSKYPICSIFRIRKFLRRGWSITAGQLLKMIMQIMELGGDYYGWKTKYEILLNATKRAVTGNGVSVLHEALNEVSAIRDYDLNLLEEQLTGVDAAYFMELVRILRDKSESNSSVKIDNAYISEVIDKIF